MQDLENIQRQNKCQTATSSFELFELVAVLRILFEKRNLEILANSIKSMMMGGQIIVESREMNDGTSHSLSFNQKINTQVRV